MYINGAFIDHLEQREIINPATKQVIAKVAEGNEKHVHQAVEAADKSFYHGAWGRAHARERAEKLFKLADLQEADQETFAIIETLNNGKILKEIMLILAT